MMTTGSERSYPATSANGYDTTLRVAVKEHGVELWIGKRQGRDWPRRALIGTDQARDLLAWLVKQV